MATASLRMPSPKRTALRTGNLSGLVRRSYFDKRHCCDCICGAKYCAEQHDIFEGECRAEDYLIEKEDEKAE